VKTTKARIRTIGVLIIHRIQTFNSVGLRTNIYCRKEGLNEKQLRKEEQLGEGTIPKLVFRYVTNEMHQKSDDSVEQIYSTQNNNTL
jgi:hypothetical protein